MVDGIAAVLEQHPTTVDRSVVVGLGEGGDRTLVIDAAAEDEVFAQLGRMHAAGHDFIAVSEERGEVAFGESENRVVIDPIDGSLNAKRVSGPCALSVAVDAGPVARLALAPLTGPCPADRFPTCRFPGRGHPGR